VTSLPAEQPGGSVHEIHPALRHDYDRAYVKRYQLAMDTHRGESLDMLKILREEATPAAWGPFTPEQRGSLRGLLDALDRLIYDNVMETGEQS
jgi:hypothetical protein